MYFKPVDEMSLRQLFSTDYAKSQLRLAYLGPVVNDAGETETSPDALILDMRKSPHHIKRCEFKFFPSSVSEFSDNGKFDIAVVWDVRSSIGKAKLLNGLLEQNGCSEIVLMSEYGAFNNLPSFNYKFFSRGGDFYESITRLAIKRGLPSVVALYISARLYPSMINSRKTAEFLLKRFPEVAQMKPQGRGNIISAFMQTNPPLMTHMNLDNYRLNDDFDAAMVASLLDAIIRKNFGEEPPSDEEIKRINL